LCLSHFHEDHFDRVAEERLARTLPIVTTPHAADKLARVGFGAAEPLTTWQTLSCRMRTRACGSRPCRARHGPRLVSALLPPVMGSMLEFETSAGDRLPRLYITMAIVRTAMGVPGCLDAISAAFAFASVTTSASTHEALSSITTDTNPIRAVFMLRSPLVF
jgi:hypothetical protein